MKTRKSISGKDEQDKDVLESSHQEGAVNCKVVSSPIVRTLRSRVITSDSEDNVPVKSKTPQSQRKAVKESVNSSPPYHNDATKDSSKYSRTVGLTTRTPKPNKRHSVINLFTIVEDKGEINSEECREKAKEEANDLFEVLGKTPVQEAGKITNRVANKRISIHKLSEEGISDEETVTEPTKEEDKEKEETPKKDAEKAYLIEYKSMELGRETDSDDSVPEAVSFSSAKNKISRELSVIAEANRRGKEKMKERARRKIEMIMMQKADKEKKLEKKMKFSEDGFPESLSEDVDSRSPDMPTVKKSASKGKKRKSTDKGNNVRVSAGKEDFRIEEFKEDVKEEVHVKNEFDGVLSNKMNSSNNTPVQEVGKSINRVAENKVSMPGGTEEDFYDQETPTIAIKKEDEEKTEVLEEKTKIMYFTKNEPMESGSDSDSDDNMPEAVSFSSAKNTISTELSVIAEAIRREKEKRKERAKRKIEMIRMQKAEKEKKREKKMKFSSIIVPERLPENVASSLPDRPDIPTVKKSMPKEKKGENEEKVEKLEHVMEKKKSKLVKFDDYIPITGVDGSTEFGVVPLEVISRLPKTSSLTAAEFKRNALFGSRIPREPSKNLLVYRQKLFAAGRLKKGGSASNLKGVW